MRRLAAWFVGALVLAIGSARARAQDRVSSEPEPSFVALEGDGSAPRADDLLVEAGILRGPSERPVLRRDGPRLFERGDDGKERLVRVEISGGGHDASSAVPVADALAMPAETIAGLRGVTFIDWQPEFGAIVSKIDGPGCFVRLTGRVGRRLPELPAGVRALEITGHLDESLDLASLARLLDLRRLAIDGYRVADWSPLAGLARLRHLKGDILPEAAPTVPSLPGLVSYATGIDDDVTDISFIARFPLLESLDVGHTGVIDLTPIAGVRAIREVDATACGVSRLPAGSVPSLRKLKMLAHRVSDEELRAFRDANPQCTIDASMRARLVAQAAGADTLRVRTGGQCHRSPLEEDVLFETKDADEIRTLLDAIAIDEPATGGLCMCCGDPTLEFLRAGALVASLSMHHGQALRFRSWPGDGRLLSDSADAVCEWLTKRGAPQESPRQVAAREAKEDEARDAAQDRLLGGAERGAAARACGSMDSFAKLVLETLPEAADRIRVLVRLAHSKGGTEKSPGGVLAERADDVLRLEDGATLAAALTAVLDAIAPADLRLAAAAAVYSLDGDRDSPLPAEATSALRISAARAWIAAGDMGSRRRAVHLLDKADSPESRALAMSMLPSVDAKGVVTPRPTRDDMDLALEIARFCDESDFARMRALAAASRDPKRYGEWIDEVLDRRQKAAERKAAEPKAGESKGDGDGAPAKAPNPEDAAGGR